MPINTEYRERSARKLTFGLFSLFFLAMTPLIFAPSAATQNTVLYRLEYEIDRSDMPPLSYHDLTLNIVVGQFSTIDVEVDSADAPYAYDSETGILTVTTTGTDIKILLKNGTVPAHFGQVTKGHLKDNKRWAHSHGFDDNAFLRASIDVYESYGLRGTLFLIGDKIKDDRNADWIEDTTRIQAHLGNGWSIGNHTYDHSCVEGTEAETIANIRQANERLQEIVDGSPRPDYKVISFAAPCFRKWFNPVVVEMRDNGEPYLQYDESNGQVSVMSIAPGASDFWAEGQKATAFDFDMRVGRISMGSRSAERIHQYFDWMSTYATDDRAFWFNTLLHGNSEEKVEDVLSYLVDTYGTDGTNEAWIAPADHIYSYLIVRDRSVVQTVYIGRDDGQPFVTPTFTPSPIGQPTSTPNPTQTSTPIPIGDLNCPDDCLFLPEIRR